MVDQPTPEAIQKYRDMLLTNPTTYRQKLEQGREAYRSRVEGLFIDRELTEEDETLTDDEDARKQELDRIDALIFQTGGRVEAIDAKIVEHDKQHPPEGPQLNRTQRRELKRKGVDVAQLGTPKLSAVPQSDEEPALTEPAEAPEAE